MSGLPRIRTVAVTGNGVAAFAAAAAFRRGLPDAEIMLFPGGEVAAEYPGAAAPFIHRFHAMIGLDPDLFRRRCGAELVREAQVTREGIVPFRFVPLPEVPHVDGAALHQLWLRWIGDGSARAVPSWPDVARRAMMADDLAMGLGTRFDAQRYLALLTDFAASLGVRHGGASDIASLSREFDFVIDAGIGSADEADWKRIEGLPGSLQWRFGLPIERERQGIENLRVWAEAVAIDNPAWSAEGIAIAGTPSAGRIIRAMQGNVVKLGRAAVECETADGVPLAVALSGIVRALEFLPRPGSTGGEGGEYNRRSAIIHDFLLDWAAQRLGAPAGPVPGLAALQAQFAHRGRSPFRDEDPVPSGWWTGWLLGSGIRPQHIDLTAMALPDDRLRSLFERA